jgi:hypothetical protein
MMNAKNAVIIASIGLGEALLILMFVTRVLHGSVYLYLLMIPWAFFLAIMIARPNWLIRMMRASEEKSKRDMERLDKWTPPGFP